MLGIRREKSMLVIDPVMPAALDGVQARLPVAGRMVTIVYRLGGNGCGPTQLELNGAALPFTRGRNPYRVGAAQVSMAALRALPLSEELTLVVYTG